MDNCHIRYRTNMSDLRFQRAYVSGVVDLIGATLTIFVTSPFLFIGLVDLFDLPTGEPLHYPNTKIVPRSNAIQNANSQWIQALFIAMGFANAQPKGVSNGMTAYSEGQFSEYMYRYLNPTILGGYYPTYTQPGSSVIQFWADEVALADPNGTNNRLNQFLLYLHENSSVPLYNPPGQYIINLDPLVNTEPYITDLNAYLAANANKLFLMTEQQNSPDLAPEQTSANPLANNIDSINFAGGVPDAILWD